MKKINEIWWALEDITDILDDITTQLIESPELKAVAAVAMQNRVALDAIYAEQGGMCLALGIDHCCTFVPDQTGNWTAIRDKIKDLKHFLDSQEDNSPQWTWLNWLNSASWIHILQKCALLIGLFLLVCSVVFCCVVPFVRSMISNVTSAANTSIYVQNTANVELTAFVPDEMEVYDDAVTQAAKCALKYEWSDPDFIHE